MTQFTSIYYCQFNFVDFVYYHFPFSICRCKFSSLFPFRIRYYCLEYWQFTFSIFIFHFSFYFHSFITSSLPFIFNKFWRENNSFIERLRILTLNKIINILCDGLFCPLYASSLPQLYNFFNALLTHIPDTANRPSGSSNISRASSNGMKFD